MRRLPAASASSSASAAAATATTEEEESEWHEVLATCADDLKVMVWNARTWALMHMFERRHPRLAHAHLLRAPAARRQAVLHHPDRRRFSSPPLPSPFASIPHSSDIVSCVSCCDSCVSCV
jgi:hypothetical protein